MFSVTSSNYQSVRVPSLHPSQQLDDVDHPDLEGLEVNETETGEFTENPVTGSAASSTSKVRRNKKKIISSSPPREDPMEIFETTSAQLFQVVSQKVGTAASSVTYLDSKKVTIKCSQEITPISLDKQLILTKPQESLINDLFDWAFNSQICLFELWGVDLFKRIRYMDVAKADIFAKLFSNAYLSILVSQSCAKSKDLKFTISFYANAPKYKDLAKKRIRFECFSSIEHILTQIAEFRFKPQERKVIESTQGSKSLKRLQTIHDRLELIEGILKKKDGLEFLNEHTLDALKVKFPGVARMKAKHEPKKALQDLEIYIDFVSRMAVTTSSDSYISLDLREYYPRISEALKQFRAAPSLEQAWIVKQAIFHSFIPQDTLNRDSKDLIPKVMSGEINYRQYYHSYVHKYPSRDKDKEEFIEYLFSLRFQRELHNEFNDEFFMNFENTAAEMFPGEFFASREILNQMLLITSLMQLNRSRIEYIQKYRAFCQIDLSLNDFQMYVLAQAEVLTSSLLDAYDWKSVISELRSLKNYTYTFFYPILKNLSSINDSISLMKQQLSEQMITHREMCVDFLQKFVGRHSKKMLTDPEFLEQLTDVLDELFFEAGVKSILFSLFALQVNILLAKEPPYALNAENLFAEELVDYMSSRDFIESNLQELLQKYRKPGVGEETSSQSTSTHLDILSSSEVSSLNVPSTVSPSTFIDQLSPSSASSSTSKQVLKIPDSPILKPMMIEELSVRRGMKTRKLIAKLRTLGFLSNKEFVGQNKSGGSHDKKKHPNGPQAIVPKHSHLPIGTLKSIVEQATSQRRIYS